MGKIFLWWFSLQLVKHNRVLPYAHITVKIERKDL